MTNDRNLPECETPNDESTVVSQWSARKRLEVGIRVIKKGLLPSIELSLEQAESLLSELRQARERVDRLQEEIEALTHEGRQGELEQANVNLSTENERLREGLRFYAHGSHWINELHNDKWDTCSGEPQNWYWRENAEDAAEGIEDGGIAQIYLRGERPDWEDEPPLEHPCESLPTPPASGEK